MEKCKTFTHVAMLIFGISLLALSCKKENAQVKDKSEEERVNIEIEERSPAFPEAKARFLNVQDGDTIQDDNISIVVKVDNFELGIQTDTERAKDVSNSAKGQHVHVILDNKPYLANYKAGMPFELGVLDQGPHTLVAFPSRSYHESVKSSEAAQVVNFYVRKEKGQFLLDATKPTIIYSRPKGKYEGKDARKIMLDFYLNNVELSQDGYKAKYTIERKDSGQEVGVITMAEWKPAFVTGLVSGEYVVTLQLLDKDGNIVEGTFNNTERVITVVTQ